MEALDNGVKIGEITGAAGALQTRGLTSGTHSFTARAVDDKSAMGLSSAVSVTASAGSSQDYLGFIGDSITGQRVSEGANTTGYTVNSGTGYVDKVLARLALPVTITPENLGFEGKSPRWFIDNQLAALEARDWSAYRTLTFSVGFVGGNGLTT